MSRAATRTPAVQLSQWSPKLHRCEAASIVSAPPNTARSRQMGYRQWLTSTIPRCSPRHNERRQTEGAQSSLPHHRRKYVRSPDCVCSSRLYLRELYNGVYS